METYVILRRGGWRTPASCRRRPPLDRGGRQDARRHPLDPQLRARGAERRARHGLHLPGLQPGGDPRARLPRRPARRRDRRRGGHRDRPARPAAGRGLREGENMMRKRSSCSSLAVVPVLAVAGIAVASTARRRRKAATARYHDLEQREGRRLRVKVVDVDGDRTCIAPAASARWASTCSTRSCSSTAARSTRHAGGARLRAAEQRHLKLVAVEYVVSRRTGRRRQARAVRPGVRRDPEPGTATASRRSTRSTPGSGSRTRAGC